MATRNPNLSGSIGIIGMSMAFPPQNGLHRFRTVHANEDMDFRKKLSGVPGFIARLPEITRDSLRPKTLGLECLLAFERDNRYFEEAEIFANFIRTRVRVS